MLVMVITCMLFAGCAQSNRAVVNVVGRGGSGGVTGIPTNTDFGGHPCVKGRGASISEMQQQLSGEYSTSPSDRWAGQTYFQEVGASSGRGKIITFTMAPGRQVFVDNGSNTPCYLVDCCNRIWPVPPSVVQSESGSPSVVINQSNTNNNNFWNKLGEGLGNGAGFGIALVGSALAENASQWNGGYQYYQQPYYMSYRSRSRYCPPVRNNYHQQRYCPPTRTSQYCPPTRQQYCPPAQTQQPYCPPASPTQSVGRGGSAVVFSGAHNRTRDPNGAH